MKTFGETIRTLREKKGLLLRQVAAVLEIDTALISKLERGERIAHKEQVQKLAKLFDVTEESLIIIWLSDKVFEIIESEPSASKVLKATEKRIKRN